jgi:hypothetical protein
MQCVAHAAGVVVASRIQWFAVIPAAGCQHFSALVMRGLNLLLSENEDRRLWLGSFLGRLEFMEEAHECAAAAGVDGQQRNRPRAIRRPLCLLLMLSCGFAR